MLTVNITGMNVELKEGDILDMKTGKKIYKIKLTKITENVVDLIATDTGEFDDNSRIITSEPRARFKSIVSNRLAWDYIIEIVRGEKVINTFHPY